MVASPGYLARHGTPAAPAELASHQGLLVAPDARTWRLRHAMLGAAEAVPLPRLVADESRVLLAAALAGLGIAILPEPHCRAELADGRLARVLPDWTAGSVTTTILTPHRRGELPAVRAVAEHLAAWIRSGGGSERPAPAG